MLLPSNFVSLRQAGKVGPEKTSNFWLLVRALGEFVKGEGGGLPPLSGEVRDTGASVRGRGCNFARSL